MWIVKNPEIIKFFLEAKFSCTEYSPDLFQSMAKKDNNRNFNTSSVKPSETKWFEKTTIPKMWTLTAGGRLTRIAATVDHKVSMRLINFKEKYSGTIKCEYQKCSSYSLTWHILILLVLPPCSWILISISNSLWRAPKVCLLALTWNSELHWLLSCTFPALNLDFVRHTLFFFFFKSDTFQRSA